MQFVCQGNQAPENMIKVTTRDMNQHLDNTASYMTGSEYSHE